MSVRKRFLDKLSYKFVPQRIYYKFQIIEICKQAFDETFAEDKRPKGGE